jgi:hypothetical protein
VLLPLHAQRRLVLGPVFFSMESVLRTPQGYEIMNRVRKGQMRGVEKGNISLRGEEKICMMKQ